MGARDMAGIKRYIEAVIGSHSGYVELIDIGGFTTFRVPLHRYYELEGDRTYIVGGMLEVLDEAREPRWVSFRSVRFHTSTE
jgi:hypothetical protein